jgi:hypothetical protein
MRWIFVLNLQKKKEEPRRSASARITHNPNPRFRGEDTTLDGPTYTSYAGFDEAGPSLVHHPRHVGWEQPSPHHSEGSWQQGPSEIWQHGNFNYYQQQPYQVSSDFQGGRMSFFARGYQDSPAGYQGPYMGHHPPPMGHEQPIDLTHFDTRLTTIE